MIARRGFLGALVGLVAAPAIIRVADLMPVKPSLVPGCGLRVGSTLRIRLPNDFVVRGAERVDVLFGSTQVRPEWSTLTVTEVARCKDTLERNSILTIDEITREAMRLFKHENLFLRGLVDMDPVSDPILDQPVTPVQAAALGAAVVLGHNPVVSRRFFGGVREEGSVASPGSSSSDPSRRINQETVA